MTDEFGYRAYLLTTDKARLNKLCNAFDTRWHNPFDSAKPVRIKGSEVVSHWIIGTGLNALGKRMLEQILRGELPDFLASHGIVQEDIEGLSDILKTEVLPVSVFRPDCTKFLDRSNMEIVI